MASVGLGLGLCLAAGLSYAIRGRTPTAPAAVTLSADAKRQLNRGRDSLRAGRYRDGWAELEQARRLAPHSAEVLHALGQASLLLKRFDAAAEALRASLAETPDQVPVLVDLAYALRELGQAQESVSVAERAAALAPGDRSVQVLLAQNLLRANEAKRAAEVMEKVIAGGGADPGNFLVLARARDLLDQADAAETAFRAAIDRDPGAALGRYWYAQHLLRVGKRDAAAKELEAYRTANAVQVRLDRLEQAVQVDPGNARSWTDLADARLARGDREGARRAMDRAEKLNRPYPSGDRR
jgi:predicted Zn-dependent protease